MSIYLEIPSYRVSLENIDESSMAGVLLLFPDCNNCCLFPGFSVRKAVLSDPCGICLLVLRF